ncbi:hypothetical protein CEXT_622401 [Caerostris extrusa]|uniref:Uncharacterized protein n=1 Tax=Caerostris extrusa TaxID=172846 RepID=A0AAV4SDS9_CAEEX|nr:hypothetical protein CEXT_622401 [Caerostris extrusa]
MQVQLLTPGHFFFLTRSPPEGILQFLESPVSLPLTTSDLSGKYPPAFLSVYILPRISEDSVTHSRRFPNASGLHEFGNNIVVSRLSEFLLFLFIKERMKMHRKG